jgi:ABC-type molybdate transport system permease subunit
VPRAQSCTANKWIQLPCDFSHTAASKQVLVNSLHATAKEEAARRNKSKFRTIFEIFFLDCIIKCFAVSFAHRNFGIPLMVAAKTAAKTPELNLALFPLRHSR